VRDVDSREEVPVSLENLMNDCLGLWNYTNNARFAGWGMTEQVLGVVRFPVRSAPLCAAQLALLACAFTYVERVLLDIDFIRV
jgi:hypothetical protein